MLSQMQMQRSTEDQRGETLRGWREEKTEEVEWETVSENQGILPLQDSVCGNFSRQLDIWQKRKQNNRKLHVIVDCEGKRYWKGILKNLQL